MFKRTVTRADPTGFMTLKNWYERGLLTEREHVWFRKQLLGKNVYKDNMGLVSVKYYLDNHDCHMGPEDGCNCAEIRDLFDLEVDNEN